MIKLLLLLPFFPSISCTIFYAGRWDENRVPLRQLPMPLHRYADPKAGLLDGAMFVWANGSDPEVVLLLEVSGDDLASAKWQYALAATGSAETKVNFDGRQVWHRPRVPDVTGTSTDPYWICGERVVAGDEGPSKPAEEDEGDVDQYPDEEERGYPYPPSDDPYDH